MSIHQANMNICFILYGYFTVLYLFVNKKSDKYHRTTIIFHYPYRQPHHRFDVASHNGILIYYYIYNESLYLYTLMLNNK